MQAFDNSEQDQNRQRGMFLLTIMIVMLVMVVTGLFVMEQSILGEKQVSNDQQRLMVYQVAYK